MKHNRHPLRSLCAVLLTAAMLLGITACGESSFDASGYVSAALKAVTTGDTADLEGYSKEAVTDIADDYSDGVQEMLEELAEDEEIPEDVKTEYKGLIESMMGAISYTVGEAAEVTEGSASGYTVPVTVKPLELNIKDQLTEWAQGLEEDEYDIEDLDAFYQKLYGEIAAMLKDAIAAKEYGEEKTINLTVSKNEDGLYDVEEDGLTELAENLFSTDIEDMYSDLE
jgi:hypothetical protein